MSKNVSTIGIVFVMIGTVFSLWSVIGTKTREVGTAEKEDRKQEDFKKDKRNVFIGIMFIISGSVLQIIGLFI